MEKHRVRLDDEELAVICSALRARVAGTGPSSAVFIRRLTIRLEEMAPGNPYFRLHGVPGFEDITDRPPPPRHR